MSAHIGRVVRGVVRVLGECALKLVAVVFVAGTFDSPLFRLSSRVVLPTIQMLLFLRIGDLRRLKGSRAEPDRTRRSDRAHSGRSRARILMCDGLRDK